MKYYTKGKFSELRRKTNFPRYTTHTFLNDSYQDFILNLSEMIDLICPSKRLKTLETLDRLLNNFSNS